MNKKLLRIGTTYIPVSNVEASSDWYVSKLGAELNYKDDDKAILNLANQSFFLVKSKVKLLISTIVTEMNVSPLHLRLMDLML